LVFTPKSQGNRGRAGTASFSQLGFRLNSPHLGGPSLPAQANLVFGIRAADALDEARKMPPGDERAEAMQKAATLQNAAEMLEHLNGRSAYRQNDG
jgi:hypothetical protein